MPGSSPSLESLSSPSPSPAPPPHDDPETHDDQHAALDSGSELSELTEDEQDDAREDDVRTTSRTKKRPRDRIVPQPMWDWAMKKKPEKKDKPDVRDELLEEEEEEEQAGPAKAMEEEEDDDQDKGFLSDRELTPDPDKDDPLTDNEVDVNGDDDQLDEGSEYIDEPLSPHPQTDLNGDVSADEGEEPEEGELDEADEPTALASPQAVASPDLTDEENENVAEDEPEEPLDDQQAVKDDEDMMEDEEDAVPDDVDIPDVDEPPTAEAVTPAEGILDAVDADPDATMDVDEAPAVLLSPVAVAVSSIMAGASLIQPPSLGSSQASSRSGSRASSAEPEPEPEVASEPEVEPEPERKPARNVRTRKGKGGRTRAPRRPRGAVPAELAENDVDGEQADMHDADGLDADDMDVATPDMDLDSDMQPAHRAEALDVLAQIELRFALLRERLYVEKMESLAWEEGLIVEGTHPELLHLHTELDSRRDKRMELASRRRDFEIANAAKRRKLDETGAWTSWRYERDQLQKQMISETNGKKRELERQRRAMERPPTARVFPQPQLDVPLAPSLRDIIKSSPFSLPDAALPLGRRHRKRGIPPNVPLVYPTLSELSRTEVMQDLELIMSHRNHMVYNPHRSGPELMSNVLGGGAPYGMDIHAMNVQIHDGPNRFPPPHMQQPGIGFGPPSRLPHHHPVPPGVLSHIPQMQMEQEMMASRPPPVGPGHPSQQHFGPGPGQSTLMRRSISPVPLSNGAGPSSLVPTTIGGGPVPPGGTGLSVKGNGNGNEKSERFTRMDDMAVTSTLIRTDTEDSRWAAVTTTLGMAILIITTMSTTTTSITSTAPLGYLLIQTEDLLARTVHANSNSVVRGRALPQKSSTLLPQDTNPKCQRFGRMRTGFLPTQATLHDEIATVFATEIGNGTKGKQQVRWVRPNMNV
ncbi:Sds3-like-domain-containing protein [Epithele typhae]|uniref:Sds3-like-domain-containing protein n=1 Tax=Epithele typhae TaxID=378194 RepID=UPI00200813C8|nr:Sds3-like-domain-containing protein [Epithele typhae]KAH9927981.1 Sds3-like-domain-containing protein [Epithele typhae]